MQSKLVIVDGHSSVGKSTVSKSISKHISLKHAAYWLHEECENHPIRHQEFSFGELTTAEGMEQNRLGMIMKWQAFRDSILSSAKICITEGCLLHAYDRYFIHSIWNEAEIAAYYAQIIEVIQDLQPTIVFLYRPDLRKSLEKAFLARGSWWRDLMLRRDDLYVYFTDHVYVDEDSMFEAIEFEQAQMMQIFDRLKCTKIKIDTSDERWDQYDQEILSMLGVAYKKNSPFLCDLEQFVGKYRIQNGPEDYEWTIRYDAANQCLYTTLFWPYMPMRCIAVNVFELISFPVELHFQQDHNGLRFQVRGNYDWDINDRVYTKVL
jgi:hypothetical protein